MGNLIAPKLQMKSEAEFQQSSQKKIKIELCEVTSNSSSPSRSSDISGTTGSKSRAMSALFGTVLTKDIVKSPLEKAENEMHR